MIPLYNEEAVFPPLFEALEAYRAEHPEVVQVVFVDDGSRGRTSGLVRRATGDRPGYVLVSFSRNFGHQLAVAAGLHFARADAAVAMDADLQDPLHIVTEMIHTWREGYDVVYGVRRQREGESSFKRATAAFSYRVFRKMLRLASGSLVSFSDKPLRLAVRLGLDVALLSFVGLVWVLVTKYAFAAVIPGWSSLIFVAFFFGGVQVFSLGVIGA